MNYLLVGRFHADVRDEHRAAVQAEFNEHLMQMHPKVKLAGPLKDDEGNWIGHVVVVDAHDADEARRYAERSPYHRAHLYERFEALRFDIVAGSLG
jgi:uncharacterized protein YciI